MWMCMYIVVDMYRCADVSIHLHAHVLNILTYEYTCTSAFHFPKIGKTCILPNSANRNLSNSAFRWAPELQNR